MLKSDSLLWFHCHDLQSVLNESSFTRKAYKMTLPSVKRSLSTSQDILMERETLCLNVEWFKMQGLLYVHVFSEESALVGYILKGILSLTIEIISVFRMKQRTIL